MPRLHSLMLLCLLFQTCCFGLEYYEDCIGEVGESRTTTLQSPPSSGGQDEFCTTAECVKTAGSILSMMDLAVDPCKDFYQYACGGFESQQNIPAGESSYDSFRAADRLRKKQLLKLVESAATTTDDEPSARQKMRRYYKSCTDLKTISSSGVSLLRNIVDQMGGLLLKCNESVSRTWSLNSALATLEKYAGPGIFGLSIIPDEKNVTQMAITLDQGPLMLGGSFGQNFYLNKSIATDPILVAMGTFLEKLTRIILGDEALINRSMINDVLQFDKRRAEIQQTQAELSDHLSVYNKVNVTYLQAYFGFIHWEQYFQALFAQANVTFSRYDPIVLFGTSYFCHLTPLVNEYLLIPGGKRTLQNYLTLRVILNTAIYLGGPFQPAIDEFMVALAGTKGSEERWQTCMTDVEEQVGFPLGAMFVEKYFKPGDKERADTVISNTIKSFRTRIEQATWMDAGTQGKALEKFDALVYKVAYPEWLLNNTYMEYRYSSLVVGDDYAQNKLAAFSYSKIRSLRKIHEPPDRSEWQLTPQTINGYYQPTANTVVIPAGILTSPFFYSADGVPWALNFGAIGAIAGHEVTHGFDNTGRQFDKLGNLQDWWNKESDQQFDERARCYVDKYNSYEVDGLHVNGRQTLGENIADDGGLRTAFAAYKQFQISETKGLTKLVGLQNLTSDQLFFLGWAQAWCSLQTPGMRQIQMNVDPHSPSRYRVIGPLTNSEEFTVAFKCPLGTEMNPTTSKICSLW